jgi:hypothetical protein
VRQRARAEHAKNKETHHTYEDIETAAAKIAAENEKFTFESEKITALLN